MLHLLASSVVMNLLQQGLLSTKSASLIRCATACVSDKSCASFFYHGRYHQCYHSSLVYNTASSKMRTYIGMKYYTWKHSACLHGFTYSRGADLCFKSGPKVAWKQAKAFCKKNQSKMVKIDTPQKQAAMSYFVGDIEHVWMGLRREKRVFRWNDGSTLGYTSWLPGQPVSDFTLHCGVVYDLKDERPIAWHVGDCNLQYKAMCEIPLTRRMT